MITEYLDLKLLVGTILPEDKKLEMDEKKLIRDVMEKEKELARLLGTGLVKDSNRKEGTL